MSGSPPPTPPQGPEEPAQEPSETGDIVEHHPPADCEPPAIAAPGVWKEFDQVDSCPTPPNFMTTTCVEIGAISL